MMLISNTETFYIQLVYFEMGSLEIIWMGDHYINYYFCNGLFKHGLL